MVIINLDRDESRTAIKVAKAKDSTYSIHF